MTLRILSLQCLLAFAKPGLNPETLSKQVNHALGNLFDLPTEKQKHKSGQESYRLRSSKTPEVCELAQTHGAMNIPFAGTIYAAEDELNRHLASLATFASVCVSAIPVIRVGVVGSFFFEDERPATLLGHKYLKKFQEDKVAELSIRYNVPMTLGKVSVNNITSLTDGVIEIAAQGLKSKGLIITRDINTPDAKSVVDPKVAKALFAKCSRFLSRDSVLSHVH